MVSRNRGLGSSNMNGAGRNGGAQFNPMQIVRSPCDLDSPLAEGSMWPYESIVFPGSAIPQGAVTFLRFGEAVLTVINTWVTVLEINPGENQEGRLLDVGTDEVNATGTAYVTAADMRWRIVTCNGVTATANKYVPLEYYDTIIGSLGTVTYPKSLVVPIASGMKTAIQALAPSIAGSRTVRAIAKGWLSTFNGGGSFKSGFART